MSTLKMVERNCLEELFGMEHLWCGIEPECGQKILQLRDPLFVEEVDLAIGKGRMASEVDVVAKGSPIDVTL